MGAIGRSRPDRKRPLLVIAALGVLGIVAAPAEGAQAKVSAKRLETEATKRLLGTDLSSPRLSWQMASPGRGVKQSAFRVLVANSRRAVRAGEGEVWDTGRVKSSRPWVDYDGPPLRSGTRYFWTVRLWDERGRPTKWPQPTYFETGFMEPDEWEAEWITRPLSPGELASCRAGRDDPNMAREDPCPPSPILRTEFTARESLKRARLYASGLGFGVYHLNGNRVGDHELAPAFTDYDDRVFYDTFDVTELVRAGENALGVELGRGFYGTTEDGTCCGDLAHASWNDEPKLRLELHLTYADGSSEVVRSGPGWRATTGPTLYDNLFRGETYDGARAAELGAWTSPGYDDSSWQAADSAAAPNGVLVAQNIEPARVVDTRPFQSVTEVEPGVFVFDLGQFVTGWTRIRVQGGAAEEVRLLHGYELADDGTVLVPETLPEPQNLFPYPEQTDVYKLAGTGAVESYRPQFLYHGFRYVEVTGWPAGTRPTLDDLTAEVVHTDQRLVGDFSASNPLLDRIVDAHQWGFRASAQGFVANQPVHEKVGAMGDGGFATTAWLLLLDSRRLHSKWTTDMEDSQRVDGDLPTFVPSSDNPDAGDALFAGPSLNYDSAMITIPADLYRYYDDRRALAARYGAVKRHVEYASAFAPDGLFPPPAPGACQETLCLGPPGLGDLSPATGAPLGAYPDANAWWYRIHRELARTATLLGRDAEAAEFEQEAERIKVLYNDEFLDREAGLYRDTSDSSGVYSQHVNAVSLEFGLVPGDLRQRVADNLAADVRARENHLSTGAVGTTFLWPALSHNGHLEEAILAVSQTTYPSYGYYLEELDWTTLAEEWNGGRPDLMKGGTAEWFFEDLAGIEPLKPGFKQIEVRPEVPAGLDWANASYESIRGGIEASWRKNQRGLKLRATVPANSTGLVHVPAADRCRVTESGLGPDVLAEDARAVKLIGAEGGYVVYRIGSGSYKFQSWDAPPRLGDAGCRRRSCAQRIEGTTAADKLSGTKGSDRIVGKRGDDRLAGRRGDDCLLGNGGADSVSGNPGADQIRGGAGVDKLRGAGGGDEIRGGSANDRISAGRGDDIVRAARGGRDRIDCGPGEDTAIINERKDRAAHCEKVKLR